MITTMLLGKFIPHVLLATGLVSVGYIATTREEPTPPPVVQGPYRTDGPKILVAPEDMPVLPKKENETWSALIKTPDTSVELDPTSVQIKPITGAWTVQARFRMTFQEEFDVKGSKKKGWFYVNTMTVNCTTKSLHIDKSVAFTKTGEEVATRVNLGVMPRPQNPKSFIILWPQVACAELKGVRVPTII